MLNRLLWTIAPPPSAIVTAQPRGRRTHQARAQRRHYTTRDKRDRHPRL